MADFNSANHDQNFNDETDAELSLDQLAETNGGFNMNWLFKAAKTAPATAGTASLPLKLFNMGRKFFTNEIKPTLAWKLNKRI